MTKQEAIDAYAQAYREWQDERLSLQDLDMLELRARARGATETDIRRAEAPQTKEART